MRHESHQAAGLPARPRTAGPAIALPAAASAAATTSSAVGGLHITPIKVVQLDYGEPVLSAYVEDMYSHFKLDEANKTPRQDYLRQQTYLNERMRGILVDWLVDVHSKYRQHPETFYLTVNLVDRFLSATSDVKRSELQLVGASAMLISSKFCEAFRREIRVEELVYICDKAYTPALVRDMERKILNVLQFRISSPTAFVFLSRILKFAQLSTKAPWRTQALAWYLLERMQQEYSMLQYMPSMVAAAAACTAMRMSDRVDAWTRDLAETAGYSVEQLLPCMRHMAELVADSRARGHEGAVDRKYATPKFDTVSTLRIFVP